MRRDYKDGSGGGVARSESAEGRGVGIASQGRHRRPVGEEDGG